MFGLIFLLHDRSMRQTVSDISYVAYVPLKDKELKRMTAAFNDPRLPPFHRPIDSKLITRVASLQAAQNEIYQYFLLNPSQAPSNGLLFGDFQTTKNGGASSLTGLCLSVFSKGKVYIAIIKGILNKFKVSSWGLLIEWCHVLGRSAPNSKSKSLPTLIILTLLVNPMDPNTNVGNPPTYLPTPDKSATAKSASVMKIY